MQTLAGHTSRLQMAEWSIEAATGHRIAMIENDKVRIYDATLGYKLASNPSLLKE